MKTDDELRMKDEENIERGEKWADDKDEERMIEKI